MKPAGIFRFRIRNIPLFDRNPVGIHAINFISIQWPVVCFARESGNLKNLHPYHPDWFGGTRKISREE